MEYKSVEKYLKKHNNKNRRKTLKKLAIKIMICICLFLSGLIILKYDKKHDNKINNYLSSHNINMATLNKLYDKYLGDILPFQKNTKKNVSKVFNETIRYKNSSIYKDGVKLSVDTSYLTPVIESGVVVFKGNKENYGNTVIIEQVDGVTTWYGNLNNISVDVYDYVTKGEFLGEASDDFIYLVFEKKGKYLDYKDYLK